MTLQEFLNKGKSVKEITKQIVIGDRFKDENGKDMAFTIKTLTSEQVDRYRELATSYVKDNFRFDTAKFNAKVVIECCKYPNFKDMDSMNERGFTNSEDYMRDVLLPGEIVALSKEIQALSGYNVDVNTLIEEAKN